MAQTPKALIYTRVSQDRAGGRSVAEQEREARDVCKREGWSVAGVLKDSVGASRHSKGKRAGWDQVHQRLAGGGVDVLVTWECSRAQRDLTAYAELRDLCLREGVLWNYSGHTYDMGDSSDRFRTGLDALVAEREAEETAERVQRSMRANAAAGRPHGRRLFGYRRVYDENSGALVGQEPQEDEAEIVRSIFRDYLAGLGIRTIANRLNRDGVVTATGAAWHDAQVRRVLLNPAYVARRVHRGEVVGDATWAPLVSVADFERAQLQREARLVGTTRHTRTARLLTGVGRCGVCGGKISAGHDRNKRKVYQCRASFCIARDLRNLDRFVIDHLLQRLEKNGQRSVRRPGDVGQRAARTEVDLLRSRLDEAVAEFTSGKLSAAVLAKVEADLVPRIDEAGRRLIASIVPIGIDLPEDGDVLDWWRPLTLEQQRDVIGRTVASVVILPTRSGVRTFDGDAVRIEWLDF